MDELKKRLSQIQNNTIESIEEEYRGLLRHYQTRFSTCIKDVIQQEIIGISDYKLDDWIEEMFIDEVRIAGINKIKRIYSVLDENSIEIVNGHKNNQDPVRLKEFYTEELDRFARRDDSYWLDEVIDEFRSQITRKLLYYCDPFNGISQHNIESKIDNIGYEIKPRLRRVVSQFMEEYKLMIKTQLNKNTKKVVDTIDSLVAVNDLTQEEVEEFSQKLGYSGFKLIQENNKLYAENLKTGEITELRYNPKFKTLNSVDDKLGFQITEKQYQSVDMRTRRIIIVNDQLFQTCNIDKKYQMVIVKKIEDYDFYYGYKKVTSIDEIEIVISQIKEISPQYYNELLNDPIFKDIVDKTKKHEEETKEIYLDEKDKKVKINPKTKDIVTQKLRLFGFSPLEKDDGLYLIDLTSNVEYKAQYTNGFCLLPGLKSYEFNFCTDINILYEDNLSLHHSKIKKGNSSMHIRNGLSMFSIFIGDEVYRIKLTDNGLECTTKGKDNNSLQLTENEILARIKTEFPYVVEYIEQYSEQKQKGSSTTNIDEEKALLEMAKEALKQGQSLAPSSVSTRGPKK